MTYATPEIISIQGQLHNLINQLQQSEEYQGTFVLAELEEANNHLITALESELDVPEQNNVQDNEQSDEIYEVYLTPDQAVQVNSSFMASAFEQVVQKAVRELTSEHSRFPEYVIYLTGEKQKLVDYAAPTWFKEHKQAAPWWNPDKKEYEAIATINRKQAHDLKALWHKSHLAYLADS